VFLLKTLGVLNISPFLWVLLGISKVRLGKTGKNFRILRQVDLSTPRSNLIEA